MRSKQTTNEISTQICIVPILNDISGTTTLDESKYC